MNAKTEPKRSGMYVSNDGMSVTDDVLSNDVIITA